MLTLKNQLDKIPKFATGSAQRGSRGLALFTLATLASGVNWYIQNQMLHNKN